MSGKRSLALTGHHEHAAALQPVPLDGSGGPPNKGITIDQIPGLPYCVLVVDESPTVRRMVKTCLEHEGMLVFGFPDGVQALQWLEEEICKPHVVLLDVDTSPENWFPLVHHVQTRLVYGYIAVVALSRNKTLSLEEQPVRVQGFLSKPFSPQDLFHVVQCSLRVSRTR